MENYLNIYGSEENIVKKDETKLAKSLIFYVFIWFLNFICVLLLYLFVYLCFCLSVLFLCHKGKFSLHIKILREQEMYVKQFVARAF